MGKYACLQSSGSTPHFTGLPLWLLCAAAAWEKTRRSGAGVGNRTAESVYDAGLWLLLLMLLRRGSRDGPEAGEEYSEERVLRSPAAAPPEYRFFCFSELFLSLFNALLADGCDEGGGRSLRT